MPTMAIGRSTKRRSGEKRPLAAARPPAPPGTSASATASFFVKAMGA
jgi:hypothetical protein